MTQPLFTPDTLTDALQRLGALLAPESPVPAPGAFSVAAETLSDHEAVRQKLAAWIGAPDQAEGWLLTTEALVLFPRTDDLPKDIPLAAELYRASDGVSLKLRHTPNGWLWEELTPGPETADAFIQKTTILADPDRLPPPPGKEPLRACYEVEWRLTPAPGDPASPATFRPARSRFTGWQAAD